MPRQTLSALFLIAVNIVPLVGVLIFDWSLFSIVFLYWIENGIVGFFNVLKIAWARKPVSSESRFTINGRPAGRASKLFIIPFFIFHYGMFWVVHGVFVIVFFGLLGDRFFTDSSGPPGDIGGFSGFEPRGVAIAAVALFLSHGVSFVVNFLGEREYLNVSPDKQMMEPYSRVVVLHATILGGGFLAAYFGTPVASLVLMIVLKTALDLRAHLKEHRRAEEPATTVP
jgi:hypothetical protein